eukprot:14177116-Alexandrium_andersonii.AAC.1
MRSEFSASTWTPTSGRQRPTAQTTAGKTKKLPDFPAGKAEATAMPTHRRELLAGRAANDQQDRTVRYSLQE